MALTGQIYLIGPSGNIGLAGVTIIFTEQTYLNGFSSMATTDATGHYSCSDSGLGTTSYTANIIISGDYIDTGYGLPHNMFLSPGQVDAWSFVSRCTRVVSSWVSKVCFYAGVGLVVTFHDRKGPYTCVYPGTTLQDYLNILAAPSKGRWIWQYYPPHRRIHITWPPSL